MTQIVIEKGCASHLSIYQVCCDETPDVWADLRYNWRHRVRYTFTTLYHEQPGPSVVDLGELRNNVLTDTTMATQTGVGKRGTVGSSYRQGFHCTEPPLCCQGHTWYIHARRKHKMCMWHTKQCTGSFLHFVEVSELLHVLSELKKKNSISSFTFCPRNAQWCAKAVIDWNLVGKVLHILGWIHEHALWSMLTNWHVTHPLPSWYRHVHTKTHIRTPARTYEYINMCVFVYTINAYMHIMQAERETVLMT